MIKKLKSVQKNLGDLDIVYNNYEHHFSKFALENFEICHAVTEEMNSAEKKYDLTLYETLDEDEIADNKFVLYIGD